LPSAIFVLAAALVLVAFGRASLGPAGSTVAAVSWLTMLEVIDKGRVIETDAINAAFFALALIFWLTLRQRDRSPWLTYTIPWIFVGFGILTKGPGLLLFFYSIVIAVCWRSGTLRDLVHPAHWIGVGIMMSIFAAWAIPFFLALRSHSIGQIWWHELAAILFGERGRSENWVLNFPRGLAFFLPWSLLLPFICFQKISNPVQRETTWGLFWGSLLPFIIVLLFPGSAPRYVLPLAASLCFLIGLAITNDAFEWRLGKVRLSAGAIRLVIISAIIVETIVFPIRAEREARTHHVLKPTAAQIAAAMPVTETLYAVDLPYAPYLFYLRGPVHYCSAVEELPENALFFLIESRDLPKMEASSRWNALRPQLLVRTNSFRSHDTMLFDVTANRLNP
jgi:4-amino-4-deoxy-L-arabinose transferase-like glycosyltransferase